MRETNARLVIVGEGPECERIASEARAQCVAGRVHLPGFLPDPAHYIGLFDIFALSSDSEQFPISLVEALAADLPIVATAAGDIPVMVSTDTRPLIVERDQEAALTAALDTPAPRHALMWSMVRANRARAPRAIHRERRRG